MISSDNKEPKNQYIPLSDVKGKYCYDYPKASITSDSVVYGFDGRSLKILLIERGVEPYKGYWALPGGFMRMDETIEECARRELREETNIDTAYLEQLHVFSRTDRDPRDRVVTVAFLALIRPDEYEVIHGDDASNAMWFDAYKLPPLAFDHREIVDFAISRLREILKVRPVAFELLDEVFSVDELRLLYERINDRTYDRRNFQRKLMQSNIVVEVTGDYDMPRNVPNAPEDNREPELPDDVRENLSTVRMSCSISTMSDEDDELVSAVSESDSDSSICEEKTRTSRPRRNRFFSFNMKKGKKNNGEDGSIKDIFNF